MDFLNENLLYLSFAISFSAQVYLFFIPSNNPTLILFFGRFGMWLSCLVMAYVVIATHWLSFELVQGFFGVAFALNKHNALLLFCGFFSALCSTLLLSNQSTLLHRNLSIIYLSTVLMNLVLLINTFAVALILTYFVALCFNILLAHSYKPFRGSTIYQSAIYFLALDLLAFVAYFLLRGHLFIIPKSLLALMLLAGPMAHLGVLIASPLFPALFGNSINFSQPLLIGQIPACALMLLITAMQLLKELHIELASLLFSASVASASISIGFLYYNQSFQSIVLYSFSFLMAFLLYFSSSNAYELTLLFFQCSICACSTFLIANPNQKKFLASCALVSSLAPPALGAGSFLWLKILQLPTMKAVIFISLWAILWVLGIYLLRAQNFIPGRARFVEFFFVGIAISCSWLFSMAHYGFF